MAISPLNGIYPSGNPPLGTDSAPPEHWFGRPGQVLHARQNYPFNMPPSVSININTQCPITRVPSRCASLPELGRDAMDVAKLGMEVIHDIYRHGPQYPTPLWRPHPSESDQNVNPSTSDPRITVTSPSPIPSNSHLSSNDVQYATAMGVEAVSSRSITSSLPPHVSDSPEELNASTLTRGSWFRRRRFLTCFHLRYKRTYASN